VKIQVAKQACLYFLILKKITQNRIKLINILLRNEE